MLRLGGAEIPTFCPFHERIPAIVCEMSSGSGGDETRKPSGDCDRYCNLAEHVDLASVFPASKIKAQLLRDEGVGRLSIKAIKLIGACSAIFVRELAEASAQECLKEANAAKESSDCGDAKRDDGNGKVSTSLPPTNSREKAFSQKQSVNNTTINRRHVIACIEESTSFDFLTGQVRGDVSAKEIPSYGAAYRKKRKREKAATTTRNAVKVDDAVDRSRRNNRKAGSKKDGSSNQSAVALVASSILGESIGGGPVGKITGDLIEVGKPSASIANVPGDEEILCSAIDSSIMKEGSEFAMKGDISEDEESYD